MIIGYPGVIELPPRPTWDEYFFGIAEAVSRRSTCVRSQVGAVVVDPHHRVRSTGYNDGPAGMPGCSDCPRRTSTVPPGSNYDNCVSVHAEANALLYCDRQDLLYGTLYVTRKPCISCFKLIWGTGVREVKWLTEDGTIAVGCRPNTEATRE